jgi:prephenate dehydratase
MPKLGKNGSLSFGVSWNGFIMIQKFGVSGDIGSFSEEAAMLYAKRMKINPSLIYLIDMESVLAAIEKREIEIGILPVVNLQGGLVKPAIEAMGKHLFRPVDELWLEVKQCLLMLPGKAFNQIKNIASHPQGFAQCKQYIKKEFKQVTFIEWPNTAKAARDLAAGVLPANTAVIAPERSAEVYGLEIMAKNIQDVSPNFTAFIIVKSSTD